MQGLGVGVDTVQHAALQAVLNWVKTIGPKVCGICISCGWLGLYSVWVCGVCGFVQSVCMCIECGEFQVHGVLIQSQPITHLFANQPHTHTHTHSLWQPLKTPTCSEQSARPQPNVCVCVCMGVCMGVYGCMCFAPVHSYVPHMCLLIYTLSTLYIYVCICVINITCMPTT